MRVSIGCVDGHTYISDYTSNDELMKYLEENDFVIGTDTNGQKVRVHSLEEAVEFMNGLFEYNAKNETQTATLTINGVERIFNSRHIVWWSFDTKEHKKVWP